MLHKQQQTTLIQSNDQEWKHVLLINTSYSHLHSFCVNDVSSVPATMVTLTLVKEWGWKNLLHGDQPTSNFILLLQYIPVAGLHFKWHTL
jgi:hypothetical protein